MWAVQKIMQKQTVRMDRIKITKKACLSQITDNSIRKTKMRPKNLFNEFFPPITLKIMQWQESANIKTKSHSDANCKLLQLLHYHHDFDYIHPFRERTWSSHECKNIRMHAETSWITMKKSEKKQKCMHVKICRNIIIIIKIRIDSRPFRVVAWNSYAFTEKEFLRLLRFAMT